MFSPELSQYANKPQLSSVGIFAWERRVPRVFRVIEKCRFFLENTQLFRGQIRFVDHFPRVGDASKDRSGGGGERPGENDLAFG